MLINIKCEDEEVKGVYENHGHFHKGDAGLDLFFTKDEVVKGGETKMIGMKIKCEADTSYWLMPRSSISKTPLRMANSMGLIDKGYRGEILVCVDNIKKEDYTVKKGQRLFQIVSPGLDGIEIKIVDELTKTDRGEGGFGSSGK